jgi:hypothetical protein
VSGDRASQSRTSPDEDSESYGVTSITTGFSELKWDEETSVGVDLEDMSHEQKEQYLKNMFPAIRQYDIAFVLKKCKGILCQAIDQLLNLTSLEEETQQSPNQPPLIPKSIDGFRSQENGSRGRKGKSKRQSHTNDSSRASSAASGLSDASSERRNVWTAATEDVEFILSRTKLAQKSIKSAYHANAASLPATIRALAAEHGANFSTLNEIGPLVQLNIAELKHDFQSVPDLELFGLLQMARNIPSAAHELAQVMVALPQPVHGSNVNGIAQYAPFAPITSLEPDPPRPSSSWTKIDPSSTRAVAVSQSAAASVAYTKASTTYKRGKSDHLMKGAAFYYAELGRKQAAASKASFAAAAGALVALQSTSRVLDLHGVGVADAVRIAQEKVNTWWESLGDAKYAPGGGGPVRDGYRIVTGVGRHSKDGAPRIGPAVSRMLVRGGWKVEIGHGEVIVYGKARR